LIILAITFLSSCSKDVDKGNLIKEKSLESQVYEAYEEGMKSLNEGDVIFAAKKFNEAEILFPQSIMAPKAALMAAYSYYSGAYYLDAIAELERFIKVYPIHKNIDYAHYLMAVSFYELIVDEKKDTQSIISAKKYFEIVQNKYPNTEYAIDADFKLDLINDVIASKEMYIARYYFQRKKWIPAIIINRQFGMKKVIVFLTKIIKNKKKKLQKINQIKILF
jgi:outer membrane protein assembly factor BamD